VSGGVQERRDMSVNDQKWSETVEDGWYSTKIVLETENN
jgi:hypothetical protein